MKKNDGVFPSYPSLNFDLNDARLFSEVARSGSLTLAAKRARIPKSTLSRRLSKLEEDLHTTLIRRTTRRVALTEAGERFLEKILVALDLFEEAGSTVSDTPNHPFVGTIRFTAPVNLAATDLADILARFQTLHPQIRVEVLLTDRILDFVSDRIDVALRAGISPSDPGTENLIIRKIIQDEFTLVANPKTPIPELRTAIQESLTPSPLTPSSLPLHLLLDFRPENESIPWMLSNGNKRVTLHPKGSLTCDSIPMLHLLTRAGAGVGFLPESLCGSDLRAGKLVRLFPEWSGEKTSIYLVHHRDKQLPQRVRAFLDFLHDELKARL